MPIKRYPNYYISECGDIYSNLPKRGVRLRKAHVDPAGYYKIRLTKKGETLRVHREVLKAFTRDPKYISLNNRNIQLELCRHLDGNTKNNALHNLKWGSPRENNQDQLQHNPNLGKMNKGNKQYPNEIIREIKEWGKEGASNQDIRKMYGLSKAHVSYILNGKTRKEL